MENRENELKKKRICRFCMTQKEPLFNINATDESSKSSVSLPMQIMACTSIEVFGSESMPVTVCGQCRFLMDYFYRFKQICKTSDTKLKQYPFTGVWSEPLELPKLENIPLELVAMKKIERVEKATSPIVQRKRPAPPVTPPSAPSPVKQPPPAKLPTPPAPTPIKTKPVAEKLNKSSEASPPPAKRKKEMPPPKVKEEPRTVKLPPPKILNKMVNTSPKILNKNVRGAAVMEPIIKTKEDGTIEIITEMPEMSLEPDEVDPLKNAATVQTHVYPCSECDRTFPLKQLLDIHAKNHTRQRDFECLVCHKAFFSKYDLGKHMSIHTGEKPFQCVVCQKSFSRSTLLYRHEKIHVDEPKFLCGFCDKSFLSFDELGRHSSTHMKNRPFACGICGKSFAFKQGMERHQVTHEKQQPCKCDYCDLSFMTPSKLARHLTAHAGVRPYPCKMCPKSFLMSHHLTRHMRAHNAGGVFEYKCTDCPLVFSSRDNLIYHSAQHATENLVCPLCRTQFIDVDAVTEHIKLHSTSAQSPCDYCDLIFINGEELEAHCRLEHYEDHAGNELLIKIEQLSQTKRNTDTSQHTVISNENGNDEYVDEFGGQPKESMVRGRQSTTLSKNTIIKAGRKIPVADDTAFPKNQNVEVLVEFELPPQQMAKSAKNKVYGGKKSPLFNILQHDEEAEEEVEHEEEEDAMEYDDYVGGNEINQMDEQQDDESEEEEMEQEDNEEEEDNTEDDYEEYSIHSFDNTVNIKTEPNTTSAKSEPSKIQHVNKIETPTKNVAKASTATPTKAKTPQTSQEKITSFFKTPLPVKSIPKSGKSQVADVIKSLPKGVTIIKKEPGTADKPKMPEVPKPVAKVPVATKTPPSAAPKPTQQKTPSPPQKTTASQQQPVKTATQTKPPQARPSSAPKTTPPPPVKPEKLAAPSTTPPKKPQDPTKTPLKLSNAKPKLPTATSSTPTAASTPNAKPKVSKVATPPIPADAKSSYCEMKIGDRMVKVQKLRMTKDQLDAMKKEGKIEMKGGTIIMKRSADKNAVAKKA